MGTQLSDSVQFSSVAQSCPTLWDPINCSTPGLPVHHQLPGFTQTHKNVLSYKDDIQCAASAIPVRQAGHPALSGTALLPHWLVVWSDLPGVLVTQRSDWGAGGEEDDRG